MTVSLVLFLFAAPTNAPGLTNPEIAPVGELIASLQAKDKDVRAQAARDLGDYRLSGDETAVPALVNALKDRSPAVRAFSLRALGRRRERAESAVPEMAARLKDADVEVQVAAAAALGNMILDASQLSPLADALKDTDAGVRAQAAFALGLQGKKSKRYVDDLIACLVDPDAHVRDRAASALANIGPEAKAAVPALLGASADKAPQVRASALGALGAIAPTDEDVNNAWLAGLKDPDADVRVAAVQRLEAAHPWVVTALADALTDSSTKVRQGAAAALAARPLPITLLPVLRTRLKSEKDKVVRMWLQKAVDSFSDAPCPREPPQE